MNKSNSFKKNFPWALMAFLAIGVTIAALAPYVTFNPANFNNATARYATESTLRYVGLFVHIFSGGLALILGPFQFLSKLRNRKPTLHRWMGRIYLISILLGGLSAFLIAPGIPRLLPILIAHWIASPCRWRRVWISTSSSRRSPKVLWMTWTRRLPVSGSAVLAISVPAATRPLTAETAPSVCISGRVRDSIQNSMGNTAVSPWGR